MENIREELIKDIDALTIKAKEYLKDGYDIKQIEDMLIRDYGEMTKGTEYSELKRSYIATYIYQIIRNVDRPEATRGMIDKEIEIDKRLAS